MVMAPPEVQPGFPATFDQQRVCNQNIYTTTLIDRTGASYGTVRMFKDYADSLYISVSLDALTDFVPSGQVSALRASRNVEGGVGQTCLDAFRSLRRCVQMYCRLCWSLQTFFCFDSVHLDP